MGEPRDDDEHPDEGGASLSRCAFEPLASLDGANLAMSATGALLGGLQYRLAVRDAEGRDRRPDATFAAKVGRLAYNDPALLV